MLGGRIRALIGLRGGGPRDGVFWVYTHDLKPEDLERIYTGYKLTWLKYGVEDFEHGDPLAQYDWCARLDYQSGSEGLRASQ